MLVGNVNVALRIGEALENLFCAEIQGQPRFGGGHEVGAGAGFGGGLQGPDEQLIHRGEKN